MVATKKFKAHVSSMVLRLGPITTNGKLVPIRKSAPKDTGPKFKMVTPDALPVEQRYIEPTSGAIYEPKDLARGIVIDGEMKVVDAATAKVAKVTTNLPKNVLSLVAHEAADVEGKTFPSDKNAYIFIPDGNDPANVQYAELLTAMLTDSDKALVGLASIRNVEGMYRISIWRGHLVIQQQLYPEEINDHEPTQSSNLLADKALKVIDKLTIPFDPELYRDTSAENISEFMAAHDGEVVAESDASDTVVDIASALQAFLDD